MAIRSTGAATSKLTTANDVLPIYALDTSTSAGHTTNTYLISLVGESVGAIYGLVGGTYSQQATLRVTAVDGNGRPSGLVVQSAGSYTAKPSGTTASLIPLSGSTATSGSWTVTPIWVASVNLIPTDLSNNALTLGMVADGVTNNYPILVNIIAKLAAVGITYLFIPPGRYNFVVPANSTGLILPDNFALIGDGRLGTTFLVDPTSATGMVSGVSIFFKYGSGTKVVGITIDAQNSLLSGGAFTNFGFTCFTRAYETANDWVFEDCSFLNMWGGQTEQFAWSSPTQCTSGHLIRCKAMNGHGTGFSVGGNMATEVAAPNTGLASGVTLRDCTANNNSWQGFTFYGARKCRLLDCTANSNGDSRIFGGEGVNFEWTDDCLVSGGLFENNVGAGIGGFGWHGTLTIDGYCVIRNNNQIDFNTIGEITINRGGWFTEGFPDATGGAVGAYYRLRLTGACLNLNIGPSVRVTPKTTGTYNYHLHIESDYTGTFDGTLKTVYTALSQPQNIRLAPPDASTWRFSTSGAQIYTNVNANQWMPNSAYAVGNTRRNSGVLWTCTQAGTSSTGLGPQGAVGTTGVVDGTCQWTATSLYAAQVSTAICWSNNAGIVLNDVRINNGFVYTAVVPAATGTTALTAAVGSGYGPQGSVVGATETDGGVTWQCLGRASLSAANHKLADLGQAAMSLHNAIPASGSVVKPVSEWTATSCSIASFTGGGGLSGAAQLITATTTGVPSDVVKIATDRPLMPGSYLVQGRYRNIGTLDNSWLLDFRAPTSIYNSGTGVGQYAVQLSSALGDQTSWKSFELPLTVATTGAVFPTLRYTGPTNGAQIVFEVRVIPLKRASMRDEVWCGGRRHITATSIPADMDFEVNDRIESPAGFGSDLVCTSAGSSTPSSNITATATFAGSTTVGTLSFDDPSIRVGMYIKMNAGAATYRVIYRSGTAIQLASGPSAFTNATVTAVAPVFQTLQTYVQSQLAGVSTFPTAKTAKAGGTISGATALDLGWNVITGATANDSVQLPAAVSGREVRVFNTGGVTLTVFPQSGEKADPALAASASKAISSIGNLIFYCIQTGTWMSK